MLDQSKQARVSRAGLAFAWGFTKGIVARRMLVDGLTAEQVATETRRQPDYIDRVRRDCSDDLLELARLEAEPELAAPIPEPTEDRDADDFVPKSDYDHALLLYDVRQSQRTGSPVQGPQPLEGDRDTVNATVETVDLCLLAVREVKKVGICSALSP